MSSKLVLYSTNTWIAFNIAERYFGGIHYVWCTPHFHCVHSGGLIYTVPPTSSPWEIYVALSKETGGRDRHSSKIKETKVGILKGAAYKKETGVITQAQEEEIRAVIDSAETMDFRPLLYIIPFERVSTIVRQVPLVERANSLSDEYRIENLPRDCFDVIEPVWSY